MKNTFATSVAAWLVGLCLGLLQTASGAQMVSSVSLTNISGAGNSFAPLFSADGRAMVFVSQANNLVTNDDLGMNLDVFVRDLVNSNTTLVSVSGLGVGGANEDANYPSISSNGQFVAFASRASKLVGQDTNDAWDVFVRDVETGTTRLVSVDVTGTNVAAGRGRTAKYPLESSYPIISGNGRWVAFQSSASNLVMLADTNLAPDVFIRDLDSNVTYLVSINGTGNGSGDGKSELAAMTPDARYVAFTSDAMDVVAGTDGESEELFLRDMQSGTTRWMSQDVWEFVGWPTRSFAPAMSEDGRWIAFKAQNKVGNQAIFVLLYDQQSGTTTVLSSNSLATTYPTITPDGRYVGFESEDQIYIWDSATSSNLLVTTDYQGSGPANGRASTPVLSRDGGNIAFLFARTEAGPGVTTNEVNTFYKLYVRDLLFNKTQLAGLRLDGSSSQDGLAPTIPVLSPDGNLVGFESTDDRLVRGDSNRASDVFIRNLLDGKTELVSRRQASLTASSGTGYAWLDPNCISADGRTVVFSSFDSNFDPGDMNGSQDVWCRNMESNDVRSIYYPLRLDGGDAEAGQIVSNFLANVATGGPFISPDGWAATCMTFSITNGNRSMWIHDLRGDTNPLASTLIEPFATYVTTLASPFFPSPITPDRRFILLQTQRQPTGAEPYVDNNSGEDIFVIEPSSGISHLVSRRRPGYAGQSVQTGNGASIFPTVSPDGRWIVFQSKATDLTVNPSSGYYYQLFAMDFGGFLTGMTNMQAQTNNFIRMLSSNAGLNESFTGAVFSANSRYVAFCGSSSLTLYRHDLYGGGTNLVVCTNCLNPSMSAEGQFIVYEQPRTNLVSDLYVKDMETGETYLVSMNRFGTGAGNGISTGAQISHDGRYIVFASRASDLVEIDENRLSDVFVRDRRRGVTTLLSLNRQGTRSGNSGSCNPVLAADGRTVVFQSFASDLVEGDYNNTADIFVARLGGPDTDQDGMDDDWEVLHFGKLGRDGSADFDGDGMSDGHEFSAGTDPTNLGSVLRALIVAAADGNGATVHWPAVPGKRYQVQYKDDLNADGWSDLAEEVVATTFSGSVYDPGYAENQRYYRVVILP